jgi:hypothetical protein
MVYRGVGMSEDLDRLQSIARSAVPAALPGVAHCAWMDVLATALDAVEKRMFRRSDSRRTPEKVDARSPNRE